MQPREDEVLEDEIAEVTGAEEPERPPKRWWVRDEDAERLERYFAENARR